MATTRLPFHEINIEARPSDIVQMNETSNNWVLLDVE